MGRPLVGAAGQYAASADAASTEKGRCDVDRADTFLRREDAGDAAMATDGLPMEHISCRAGPDRSTANAEH